MSIYDKASLVQIPSGYKAGKLYSVVPNSEAGDFTHTRSGVATRVNPQGLIEDVASNVPRLNYPFIDGVVQDCPHLLLEPQRTNLLIYSEDFANAVWSKISGGTGTPPNVTSNYTISPNGTNTADRVVFDLGSAVSGDNYSIIRQIFSISGVDTSSVWMKSNTSQNYNIGIDEVGTVEIVTVTPQWQLFSYTDAQNRLQLSLRGSGSVNKYADISVWGAQLELGSYPTSYIPTEGSTVTRLVDSCKLENFSNMPNNYPFTAFVDMNVISNETGFGFSIIDISTPNIYFSVGYSEGVDTNKFRFTNRSQGTGYSFNTTSTYGTGRYKIAIKFISSTNFKAFIGGVEVANYTHTSSSFNTNINDILLGQLRAVTDTGTRNSINEFMVFNEALSDSELETLTTL